MRRLPTKGMTGLAVAAGGERLVIRAVGCDQTAAARVMAVRAVGQMRRCINQCIRMTARTVISARGGYKRTVIWRRRMDRAPGIRMTGLAVAARREVLEVGVVNRCKAAVCRMTRRTGIMRISCRTYQRGIRMTVKTTRRAAYRY